MEIYCICLFYLNEQTICPILIGKHIKCTPYNAYKYTVQNMFLNFDGLYLRCVSVDLQPNVTLATHNYWFYLNSIHAMLCPKNFPNVYKPYGVTVQSKSCLIFCIVYLRYRFLQK